VRSNTYEKQPHTSCQMRSTMKESRQSHARRTERSTQELAPSMEAKGRDTRSNRITDEHARGSNDVLCSGGESRNFEIGAGAGHSYRNTSNTGLHRTICVVEVKDISDRGPYVIRESAGKPAIHISCLHTHMPALVGRAIVITYHLR
jgi:hypothetical protein